MQNDSRWSAWCVVHLGWVAGGVVVGAIVSAFVVSGNASLQGAGQALPAMAWIVGLHALAGLLFGLPSALLAARRARRAPWLTRLLAGELAALTGGVAFATCQWGVARFAWHEPEDGWNELAAALAALSVGALAARSLVRRLERISVRLGWATQGACVLTVACAAALVGTRDPQRPLGPPAARSSVTSSRPTPRVLLVGIDGLDWDRLDPLMEAGRCPNFARLVAQSHRGPLATIEPTLSPIIWNTIATGVGAELHGIEGFTEVRIPLLARGAQRIYRRPAAPAQIPPYSGLQFVLRSLVTRQWLEEGAISGEQRRAKAFWNVLSEAGVNVGVVHWWATWPAERLNGFVVSDNDPFSHELAESKIVGDEVEQALEHITSPGDLLRELAPLMAPSLGDPLESQAAVERVLADEMLVELTQEERAEHRADPSNLHTFEVLRRTDRFATQAALKLWRDKRVAMCAVYLRAVDNVSHRFWRQTGVVDRVYEFTDLQLGELLATVDEQAYVMVVSDHGWCYEPGPRFAHPDAPDGVLILRGPDVAPGADDDGAPKSSVFDIAPTILALYGLPQDRHQSGRVLVEAFEPGAHARGAPAAIASWGAYAPRWERSSGRGGGAGRAEAVKLLEQLGYLD